MDLEYLNGLMVIVIKDNGWTRKGTDKEYLLRPIRKYMMEIGLMINKLGEVY